MTAELSGGDERGKGAEARRPTERAAAVPAGGDNTCRIRPRTTGPRSCWPAIRIDRCPRSARHADADRERLEIGRTEGGLAVWGLRTQVIHAPSRWVCRNKRRRGAAEQKAVDLQQGRCTRTLPRSGLGQSGLLEI